MSIEEKDLVNALMLLGVMCMFFLVFVTILELLYVRKNKARLAELILTSDNPWTQTKRQVGIFEMTGVFSAGLTQALILYRWPHKNKKNFIKLFPGIYTKKNYTALVEENPYWIRLYKLGLILTTVMFLCIGLAVILKDHT